MKPKVIFSNIFIFLISIAVATYIWIKYLKLSLDPKSDLQVLSTYSSFLSLIVSFAGLLISFVLLNVAIKAFKNLDVKKQFISKQLDAVSDLAKESSNTTYSVRYVQFINNEKASDLLFVSTLYELIDFPSLYPDVNHILLSSNMFELTMPFIRFKDNPLLPKDIADKLREINTRLQFTKGKSLDSFSNSFAILKLRREVSYNVVGPVNTFFFEYLGPPQLLSNQLANLKQSIIDWLKKYGAEDLNV